MTRRECEALAHAAFFCNPVAQAFSGSHVVVTNEVSAPNSIRKIKIPDACIGLGIKWMAPYEMPRHERARFALEAT